MMKNSNSNNKALKSGIWYTIGNFATRAISFLTIPIFTRLLSTEEVGQFSNLTSWATILVVIVSLNLYSSLSVARFDFKDEFEEYIASNLVLGSIITILFYIISILFSDYISKWFGLTRLEIHVIFFYFLSYPAMEMFQAKNRIKYKYKLSTTIALGSVAASTLMSLAAVVVFPDRYIGRVIGFYIPLILINMVIYIYSIIQSNRISGKYWKYAIAISLPLVWHTLSANLLNSSDRVMINNICGATDNAYYSIAYSCALIVQILWASMNSAWSPWAFEKMEEKEFDTLKKASVPYMILFGIVVLGFILLAPEVIWIMGGDGYMTAVYVIPPVMVAYVFQFVYSLYVNIEIYAKKTKYIALGTTIAALVNIGLNIIFIPLFGYVAAAYTTLAGYIVLFLIHYLFTKKIGKEKWYSTSFNFCFLAIFLVIMVLSIVLYSHTCIRYCFILIIITLCFSYCFYYRAAFIQAVKEKSISSLMNLIKL